jgi:hypothetical protein
MAGHRDILLARVAALEARQAQLERRHGAPALSGTVIGIPGHEPAPGTWDAHARTGVCRHCELPISGGTDSHHGWSTQAGGTGCLAHPDLAGKDHL